MIRRKKDNSRRANRRNRLMDNAKKRNSCQFKPKWDNKTSALIGYYLGQGMPYAQIADRINIRPSSIERLANYWGIPRPFSDNGDMVLIPVPLMKLDHSKITKKAKEYGVEPQELVAKVMTLILKDDMWEAVIDERS